MKKLLLLFIVLFTIACAKSPISTNTKNNFEISFLFEQDNCKVYRFWDAGYHRYFVTCTGRTMISYSQSKTTRPDEITTSTKE